MSNLTAEVKAPATAEGAELVGVAPKEKGPCSSVPPSGAYGCTFNTAGLRIDVITAYRPALSAGLGHDFGQVLVGLNETRSPLGL